MSLHSSLAPVSPVLAPDSVPGAGACELVFFDLDRTLISGYSISAFALERLRSGATTPAMLWIQARAFGLYLLGRWDYERLTDVCMAQLAGEDAGAFASFSERVYRRHLRRKIYPDARRLVRRHKAAGRHVVMVTSASRFQAAPIARSLRIGEICCTELQVVDGILTGRADTCFGAGKLRAASTVAQRMGASLAHSRFYTDSEEDLALLDRVGRPVAVNPKRNLRQIAARRDWPVLDFPPIRPVRTRTLQLARKWRRKWGQSAVLVADRLRGMVTR
ncbi:MAG: HAD-IB family hydrolase [Pseudomonadaceae bacterium]|nr:HAD-IB family hydrolase [Pseudomonadaceae bacterium]